MVSFLCGTILILHQRYQTPDEVYYQGANSKYYDAKKALLGVA